MDNVYDVLFPVVLESLQEIEDVKQRMCDYGFMPPDAMQIIMFCLQEGCYDALKEMTMKG